MNSPDVHQADLLRLIAEGDEQAFYSFYKTYRAQLREFAFSYTKNETDAEDILQETFMRVWLSRDRLAEVDNPRAWLYTVNAHVCANWLRSRLNHERKNRSSSTGDQEKFTPFEAMHGRELQELIRDSLERMPEKRRRVFTMSRELGMRSKDIAAALGISDGTVRNTLVQALKDIRSDLAAEGIVIGMLFIYFGPNFFF